MNFRLGFLLTLLLFSARAGFAEAGPPPNDVEAAYERTIQERAERIASTLSLTNIGTVQRVQRLIAEQYRSLRSVHDPRDAAIADAKTNSANSEASIQQIQSEAKSKLDRLHTNFLAQLDAELTPEQIDQVKDGMTFGVLNVTWNTYMKMFPNLNEEQKAQIRAWLVEARELAMDQGTAREKHAVFGKYKGRINNFLSKAGYDLKKAEQNLRK